MAESKKNNQSRIKYADLLGDWLVELGYTHCFFVAGGGCMHLIDGFRDRFECIPVVHENTAGVAAEHFNECSFNQKAFALVTTGPGLTNVVTAIAGCYVEHRELLVIAGQVKSTDLRTPPVRQRGVQEVDGVGLIESISVTATCLRQPVSRSVFVGLVNGARKPHPGPVFIEVCLDVQGAQVDRCELEEDHGQTVTASTAVRVTETEDWVNRLADLVSHAERPVFLLGGLISRATAWQSIAQFEQLGVPVLTTTSAIDRIPTNSPVFAGRPGTWGGQRAANLILAQADIVLVLGAQLDLQQTGFNFEQYAPNARLFQIFPCNGELSKGAPVLEGALNADPDQVLGCLLNSVAWVDRIEWLKYVQEVRLLVPAKELANVPAPGFPLSFEFFQNLSKASSAKDILALCSSGGTFTGALQMYEIASRQFATTSAAFASMGYGLATAVGVSFANPGRTVLLTEGDGGFAQSLQELAIVKRHELPLKIFIIDNDGYASIRATQRKFFDGAYVGCDSRTGLGFPSWVTLFEAYGIPCRYLETDEISVESLRNLIHANMDPEAWILRVDPEQPNWPAVSSKLLRDGRLISNPIYDMSPPLSPEIEAYVTRYL
jgi:acetolactate synthase-1/2/3 large subunit